MIRRGEGKWGPKTLDENYMMSGVWSLLVLIINQDLSYWEISFASFPAEVLGKSQGKKVFNLTELVLACNP